MTRAYQNFQLFEKNFAAFLRQNDATQHMDEIRKIYMDDYLNTPFKMASRMVRFHSEHSSKFVNMLRIAMSQVGLSFHTNLLEGCPLIVPGKTNDTFRVFINIPIADYSTDAMHKVSPYIYPNIMQGFNDSYLVDLKGPGKDKWASVKRIWTRVKKFEEIPTSRVLSRYTNLELKLGCTAANIRDIANAIDDQRKPMELIYAEKPEDMLDMYATGPNSCMSTAENAKPKKWDKILFPHKIHPTSFFAYHPYIKGVYAKSRNNVIARSFLYKKEDDKWYHGRVYATDPKTSERFKATMASTGYKYLGGEREPFSRKAEFTIPGIKYEDYWYMPLPYCDNLGNFRVDFDAKTHEFLVKMGHAKNNCKSTSANGFMTSINIGNEIHCSRCDNMIQVEAPHPVTQDGLHFCGNGCLGRAGFVTAYDSQGTIVYVRADSVFRDELQGQNYTNRFAALVLGCVPMMTSYGHLIESEDALTRQGPFAMFNNTLFHIDSDMCSTAVREGILKMTSESHNGGYIFAPVEKETSFPIFFNKVKTVTLEDNDALLAAA